MPDDLIYDIPRIFFSLSLGFFLKAIFVLLLVFYLVFAIIILRQVQIMSNTLVTPFSPILRFVAIFHLGLVLASLMITFALI